MAEPPEARTVVVPDSVPLPGLVSIEREIEADELVIVFPKLS